MPAKLVTRALIKKGAYFDSVMLMTVGQALTAMDGVKDAAVVMGTRENKAILESSGLLTDELASAADTDLLIAVKATSAEVADRVLAEAQRRLKAERTGADTGESFHPASLEGALKVVPEANVAIISVAGRYAGREARRALEAGMHVMLFSDNVPIETELALKTLAHERGLMLMGPDCGTAIINGVPLAFANAINRGDVGIVAASGTGLQEVSCIISNEGTGISQAIGTGGRDVKKEIGGITFLDALEALVDDDDTRVIVLVSKPPDKKVLDRIRSVVQTCEKPVVSVFLGSKSRGPNDAATLEEAALRAVALRNDRDPAEVAAALDSRDQAIWDRTEELARELGDERKYVRGLMSGGTFVAEAQVIFSGMITDVNSNVPTAGAHKLRSALKSVKNSVVDLGADEFTVGRPHPMIDYSVRKARMLAEAQDPQTAVILLDVVLGFGSNPDPASELSDVISEVTRSVPVVCSVTGTHQDPQDRAFVERELTAAGAIVTKTNAAACKMAGYLVKWLAER